MMALPAFDPEREVFLVCVFGQEARFSGGLTGVSI